MEKDRNIFHKEISDWLDNNSIEGIHETESALNLFAKSQAVFPRAELKNTILNKINLLNKKRKDTGVIDINNPPLISEESNHYDWLMATKEMKPPVDFKDLHLEPIITNEKVEMFVAWVAEMVPEEVHDDMLESFLILEGSCTCHITNPNGQLRIIHMQAGDFITMNVGEVHDIQITSKNPTKAILQWLKIAA